MATTLANLINPASLRATLERLVKKGEIGDPERLQIILPQIEKIIGKIHTAVSDGIQMEDINILPELVEPVMLLVESVPGLKGAGKKQLAIETAWLIYKAADTGIDGKQNNFKVPLLHYLSRYGINMPEEKVERWAIEFVVGNLVELAHKYLFCKDDCPDHAKITETDVDADAT